jgi:alkaline phosphatase D
MSYNKTILTSLMAGMLCSSIVVPAMADSDFTAGLAVSAGDVTSNSAVIWSRAARESVMHVQILGKGNDSAVHQSVRVDAERDFTGKVKINGLKPNSEYRYRVWFGDEMHSRNRDHNRDGKVVEGQFRTAPTARQSAAVSLAWGGDLAGQNTCRDAVEGFPIFNAINRMQTDFFIGLGDMIYADGTCESTGRYGNTQVTGNFTQAFDMPSYWAHWKYNQADQGYKKLLASTPYYAIWDDHEVVNDFGPLHDTRDTAPYIAGEHLMPKGLNAFLDYNPVAEDSATPKRLYRNVRWGKHMEMFILDTRQYRDANFATDDAGKPKTMLGREQLVWLKEKLKASDATWKVIVSSVPMSIPTGSAGAGGRDGWGNYQQDGGFEYELSDVLRFMQQQGMYNVAFLTTDVHFAEVFRFTPFMDDPSFQVYEFVSGPINAGVFPNQAYDYSLNPERLFFFGANSANDVTTWEQAKSWFNYGAMQIDENGRMTASINNVNGDAVYQISVDAR